VGSVDIGGGAPISVQSMTDTKTHDVNATLQQIAALNAAGVDIVRVACPRKEDADALAAIAAKSPVPIVADIHFQWKYAMKAIEAGVAKVRINPGNIHKAGDHSKVKVIAKAAAERGIPIRIGVNGGSLEKRLLAKHGGVTPEALVESALDEVALLEEVGFGDIAISVKHSDPWVMIQTYRLLADRCDYPLHLGVTEAGPPKTGAPKSAAGITAKWFPRVCSAMETSSPIFLSMSPPTSLPERFRLFRIPPKSFTVNETTATFALLVR